MCVYVCLCVCAWGGGGSVNHSRKKFFISKFTGSCQICTITNPILLYNPPKIETCEF